MSYIIPMGPAHPALEEPYKIELTCEGEKVKDAKQFVQFNSRAIEWLLERRNFIRDLAIVERVCGICSHLHTLIFCMSVERIAGLEIPERAQYIRTIMAELERLASHFLWLGLAAKIIGFQTVFMTCFALREKVMDTSEKISGNRVHFSVNCIGGVYRDIADTEAVLKVIRQVRQEVENTLMPVFTADRTIRARCGGVGVLSREQAIAWGTVGPSARASGVPQDIRKASPYAAYDRVEFKVPIDTAGDVLTRVVVRLLEMMESTSIIEQSINQMRQGPLSGDKFVIPPPGETTARAEAPRGECFYYVASDGSDIPLRVKIRTPTFVNMPTVRLMVLGADLADVSLIQASIDPCYSCTSR